MRVEELVPHVLRAGAVVVASFRFKYCTIPGELEMDDEMFDVCRQAIARAVGRLHEVAGYAAQLGKYYFNIKLLESKWGDSYVYKHYMDDSWFYMSLLPAPSFCSAAREYNAELEKIRDRLEELAIGGQGYTRRMAGAELRRIRTFLYDAEPECGDYQRRLEVLEAEELAIAV